MVNIEKGRTLMTDTATKTRWRMKPVEVDAIYWDGTEASARKVVEWSGGQITPRYDGQPSLMVRTKERPVRAFASEWIVRVSPLYFEVYTPEKFADRFEPISDDLPEIDPAGDAWKVFKEHRPVSEYLPVGQLAGDCHGRTCGGAWPCEEAEKALAALGFTRTGVPASDYTPFKESR